MNFFEWAAIVFATLHAFFFGWVKATNWQSALFLKIPSIIIDLVLLCYILYANEILIL